LVDLEIPEIAGAKRTLLVRWRVASPRTPHIVLTAAGGPREWQRLSAIGADAFLVKPVNADDVELLIRRTLRSRHSAPPSQGEIPVSNRTAESGRSQRPPPVVEIVHPPKPLSEDVESVDPTTETSPVEVPQK
jgi:DNA-binding response OmpR family regulator